MLLTCSEMRAVEERAFAEGITAEILMEEAGRGIARAVQQFFATPGRCVVVFGKGHNGGDALVAARHLAAEGWSIDLRPAFSREAWAELTARQHERLPAHSSGAKERPLVVLDGLLGIGTGGTLREPIRSACQEINRLRRERSAHVFALDLPTGLDGDTGAADPDAVIADTTLAVAFGKIGLLADGALNHVGRLAVVPLPELARRVEPAAAAPSIATAATLAGLLPPRAFDTHKGACGRVGIVAGSRGYLGAAVLCADAAVHGGAGLVTLHVPREIYEFIAPRTSPEVMVRSFTSPSQILNERYDVIAIGPGLGREHPAEIFDLITRPTQPTVLDADALNLLATEPGMLELCAGPRLLTPHPGEMARLDPESPKRTRAATVEAFIARNPHTLLLKGSRTLVGQAGHALSYNSTGHPGMATGGIGDVLTGLLAALAGQGLSFYHAARLGSWLIGRAAENAVFLGPESAETLRPTALLANLGTAFRDLRSGVL